jgi:RsiW-degrading membrane proteinase PrsW (M82 family)
MARSLAIQLETGGGAWERWRARLGSLVVRHPVAARRLRVAWVTWTWLSLGLYAVALLLVPSLRQGMRPWLWCYWILLVWFLLGRTKTLSWRFLALTFSGASLLAPLIGLAEVAVAGLAGADVDARDGAVLIAGPLEETLKLVPLLVILPAARQRARRLGVVDHLLLGFAAGLGLPGGRGRDAPAGAHGA